MSLPRDTKGWFYPGKFSLFYDKYKEKFPWTAWFKVEGKETVNEKENVREGKRGRYVFVIVTLLVIACVVPMIQYYS